jgi:hypothetical protein
VRDAFLPLVSVSTGRFGHVQLSISLLICRIPAVALILSTVPEYAQGHDAKAFADAAQGDTRRWQWFDELKQPTNGKPCCNMIDCYRTEAKQLPDGSWRAITIDNMGKRWVQVPSEKVVKYPLSIDGEAYICNSHGNTLRGGDIFCFIPPIPGY